MMCCQDAIALSGPAMMRLDSRRELLQRLLVDPADCPRVFEHAEADCIERIELDAVIRTGDVDADRVELAFIMPFRAFVQTASLRLGAFAPSTTGENRQRTRPGVVIAIEHAHGTVTERCTPPPTNPYKRHRFPAEIISHSVWLYYRFCLS
jgi:hypothetical protein